MLGHRELGLDDYLAMGKRHRWLIIIPILIMPFVGFAASYVFPNKYTSQTLVLVEQQKVPDNYVRPLSTEGLQERLMTMQEQILSRSRLEPLIQSFGLYKEDRKKVATEDLVDRIRKAITVVAVKPTITTKPGVIPGFTVAFTGDSPQQARDMCQQITGLFIEENLKRREMSAENTRNFLKKNLDEAQKILVEKDQKLAAFKARFLGHLPGQEQTTLNILMATTQQLEVVSQALNRARQDRAFTESLLNQALAAANAVQSGGSDPLTLDRQVAFKQDELQALQAKYTASHPDVTKARNELEMLKKKVADAAAASKAETPGKAQKATLLDPPQIQQFHTQIHVLDQTIDEKTREQERLQEQVKTYRARVELSPAVEEQFKDLTRDYQIAQNTYDDLLRKQKESELALDLERQQQGETFRLYDPANLPERPSFPDRKLFAAGGLGAGFVLGFGLAMLLELRDKSLRSEKDIEFYLELPALAMVPTVGDSGASPHGQSKGKSFWRSAPREALPGQRS